jgi:hypothetical protein
VQFGCHHAFMKSHMRISVKDFQRNKNLEIQLARVPFSRNRQFWAWTNGQSWPEDGRPVSLLRLLTSLCKSPLKPVQE